MFNGQKPNFIGIDGGNQRIYVSSYTISNQGNNSTEEIEIETQSYSISIPSGDRSDFGAIYGFGADHIYALNNSSGNIYKINVSGSGYSITDTGNDGASTSNNDGAACHAGDPDVTFTPHINTPTQGSCDGSNRQIDLVLDNAGSSVAANYVVTYTVNGGSSQSLTSGTSVSASSTGNLTIPAQADNAQVVISFYAENTANDLREPISGTTSLSTITVDASSCSSDPTAVSITASSTLGSCSGGSASSSFQFANGSGSTAYVTVEYSTDGGSTWSVHPQAQANTSNDLVISSGSSPGMLSSISVSHGSSIKWRYKSTDTEGDWTGISYVDGTSNSNLNSSTVNCPTETFTITDAMGSCSAGSAVPSATITNTANGSIFVDLQYKLTVDGTDISDWTDNLIGYELAQGASIERSLTAQPHGYQVSWRARADASSDPTSGSYTSPDGTALTVDCVTAVALTDSQSLGSCSAGSATSTLSLQNTSGSTAYVTAEYSTDGGSTWTVHTDAQEADNLTITNGQTNTSLTVSVPDGSAIQWRYKSSNASGNWTGLSYVTASDMNSATVDCPYIDPSVSQSLGSCASGSATSTLTLSNSASANTTAYFYVRYKIDSGNWNDVVTNQSVGVDSSTTLTQSVPHGSVITWIYLTSSTSNSFSGSGTEVASSTVDCLYIDPSASQALDGTCSAGAQISTLTLSNSNSANTTAYFLVEYLSLIHI